MKLLSVLTNCKSLRARHVMSTLDKEAVIFTVAAFATAAVTAIVTYLYNPRVLFSFFTEEEDGEELEAWKPTKEKRSSTKQQQRLYEPTNGNGTTSAEQEGSDETSPASNTCALKMATNRATGTAGQTPGVKGEEPKFRCSLPKGTTIQSDLGAIRSLLATTRLSEFLAEKHVRRPEGVPPQRTVLTLKPSCTVSEALSKLRERSLISAPLLSDDGRAYLGFISVHDIVGALIRHMFPAGPLGQGSNHYAPEWFINDTSPEAAKRIMTMVQANGDAFCRQTIGSIRRASSIGDGAWLEDPDRTSGVEVDGDNDPTLLDVIQNQFVSGPRVSLGAAENPLNHRVAVYRYTNGKPGSEASTSGLTVEVTDILSLSDITRFLTRWNHIEHCLTPCSVEDLGVGTASVDTVPENCTLLRAFAIMSRLGVSGLGVTQARDTRRGDKDAPEPVNARLIGSISESDLRRIPPDKLDVLSMSVGDFISKLHTPPEVGAVLLSEPMAAARTHPLFSGMLTEGELSGGRLTITCAPQPSLMQVMRALTRNRVHRVYIVDPVSGVPVSVVTHSDLIKFFALFSPAEEGETAAACSEDEEGACAA